MVFHDTPRARGSDGNGSKVSSRPGGFTTNQTSLTIPLSRWGLETLSLDLSQESTTKQTTQTTWTVLSDDEPTVGGIDEETVYITGGEKNDGSGLGYHEAWTVTLSSGSPKEIDHLAIVTSLNATVENCVATSRPSPGFKSSLFNLYTSGIRELSEQLSTENLTSLQTLSAYLQQIDEHNGRLRALIHVAPRDQLVKLAKERDDERKAGKCRGSLHGIPIVLKSILGPDGQSQKSC